MRMDDFFDDFFDALSGEDFDERPVEIEEFVTSEDFLGLEGLSENQYKLVRYGSQIYKRETLVELYGEEKGNKRWNETCNEVVMQLGKGSGKDFCSTIVCAYVVYLLLCLKDPAQYYGAPKDDTIDIVNIAVNSDQAKNAFFKNFKTRIKNCAWFNGKYGHPTQYSIEFDKQINVYSGHSEREAFEGLNLILAVLDEISAFALVSETEQATTADNTYRMYRDSVDSRFQEYGKVLLLSFPRFKDDYIQQRYDAIVAEKETIIRTETLKLDPDLPDGVEGNEFDVSWEEDHILRYNFPKVWALRRPSWEMHPKKRIEMYTRNFYENMGNALGKFACMPSNLEEGFFKNMAALEDAFSFSNGVDQYGTFRDTFRPQEETLYFVHVDLAKNHDYAAVAMSHVEKWVQVNVGKGDEDGFSVMHPVVRIDCLRWWEPTKDKSVDFDDIRAFVIALRDRGFHIKLCTFDRWNSIDSMNILEREHGIECDTLSVADKHYDDFLSVAYGRRLMGPHEDLLLKELGELRKIKNKIDHPRKGSKDLSDAVCGAIFNAVEHTPKPEEQMAEVYNYADFMRQSREEALERYQKTGVIKAPKKNIPDDIATYLDNLRML